MYGNKTDNAVVCTWLLHTFIIDPNMKIFFMKIKWLNYKILPHSLYVDTIYDLWKDISSLHLNGVGNDIKVYY